MSAPSVFIIGKGSSFSISTDGTTFTKVSQIQQVSYSGGKQNFDDVTNLDSPAPAGGTAVFEEVAPTTNSAGQCQLTGVFSDSDAGQLMFNAAFNNSQLLYVKQQMAPRTGQTKGFLRTYTAYAQEPINFSYGTTKSMTFQASLKVTGGFTDTPGS
jgi:hypothetical protein